MWVTSGSRSRCPPLKQNNSPYQLQGALLHSWPCSDLSVIQSHRNYYAVHVFSQSVHTPRHFRRCRWLMYSPKSSASCRSRASAPSTGRGTAQGSSLVSWSYPCSPPRRWNPEGSSPWCHPGPPGMWEEVARDVVVGCGHPGTFVRKELRTAWAPAAALKKPFWSLSSYPHVKCPSSNCDVLTRKQNFTDGAERETTITRGVKDATTLVIRSQKRTDLKWTKLKVLSDRFSAYISELWTVYLAVTTQALLDQAHKPERQHSCHALVFYSNFPPLCVRPANRRSGAGLRAWSSVADWPPSFFFFLIYRGKKCPCVGSFDPRSFIWCGGFYMPISHSITNLWSENMHLVTHLSENQVGGKNKTQSKLMQSCNNIWLKKRNQVK